MNGEEPQPPTVEPRAEAPPTEDPERMLAEMDVLRRQCEQFRNTCDHLNKKVERLERAIERVRKYSLVYRTMRLFMPGLGRFLQYRPRPLVIPPHYREKPAEKDLPSISIVTPSFQHEQFIERTMLSVLDQDYPRLEYIVQDGGSTDGTNAILARHRARLKHAESKKDHGQAHAVNLGFAHATGEIMAYLNSDDLLLPGALHYVGAYFKANPDVDVVYGQRVIVNTYDQEVGRWVLPEHDGDVMLWADFVPQETLFWRRRIWDKTGAHVDESFQFALDWDLLLRFRTAGAKFACLPRFLGGFRMHSLQKTMAIIEQVGYREMNRLRLRELGFEPTGSEIAHHVRGYLWRALIRQRLYQIGFVRL
ncbi:MAG: glycosyltransferase [Planctomycetota bacterium]|nr:glycosyltransferase [Planctomycetota bacterium]